MQTDKQLAVCRKHKNFLTNGYVLAGILAVVGLIFLIVFPILGILMFVVAIWGALYRNLLYKNEYLVLTEKNIIAYKGIFNTKKTITPLNRVQNIIFEQNISDRMYGYSTVKIDNAGTGRIEFIYKQMGNAEDFVSKVQEQINKTVY